MEDLHLIVTIAGERVALSVATIESVIEVGATTRVPRAAPHVAGLAALRSRVITLIDCRAALGMAAPGDTPLTEAVVVTLDGHCYGLLVETVEDVIAALPAEGAVRTALGAGWARAATGMMVAGDELLPALDPAALIAGPAAAAA